MLPIFLSGRVQHVLAVLEIYVKRIVEQGQSTAKAWLGSGIAAPKELSTLYRWMKRLGRCKHLLSPLQNHLMTVQLQVDMKTLQENVLQQPGDLPACWVLAENIIASDPLLAAHRPLTYLNAFCQRTLNVALLDP